MKVARRDFGLLLLAGILMLACLTRPTIPLTRYVFHYLFALDITQSMNARDYHTSGLPSDRLSFGKSALRNAIRKLPCGSKAGISLFSTKDVLLLIEPLEICSHFAAIDDTIAHIDWRMAWSADSNIERGLYSGILASRNLTPNPHLVFMSDGEQTVRELHRPPLAKHHDSIKGFIFGVGGTSLAPIPKLDKNNRISGYWTIGEVEEIANGSLDRETVEADSLNPDHTYQSGLRESNLKMLAAATGLEYHRLESPAQFSDILQTAELAESRTVDTDIRWPLALFSVVLIVAVYLLPAKSTDAID